MARMNWGRVNRQAKVKRGKTGSPVYGAMKATGFATHKQRLWGTRYMIGYLMSKGVTKVGKKPLLQAVQDMDVTAIASLCKKHGARGKKFNDVFTFVKKAGAKPYIPRSSRKGLRGGRGRWYID